MYQQDPDPMHIDQESNVIIWLEINQQYLEYGHLNWCNVYQARLVSC